MVERLPDARTTVELPDIYTWAFAAWPIRNARHEWKIEVDVEYADWTDFKDLDLHLSDFKNPALPPVLPRRSLNPATIGTPGFSLSGPNIKRCLPLPSPIGRWHFGQDIFAQKLRSPAGHLSRPFLIPITMPFQLVWAFSAELQGNFWEYFPVIVLV